MQKWQLQQAKARLSELIKAARNDGPQDITVHGESAVVVISRSLYDRLTKATPTLVEFMQNSPFVGESLDLERDTSPNRDVDL